MSERKIAANPKQYDHQREKSLGLTPLHYGEKRHQSIRIGCAQHLSHLGFTPSTLTPLPYDVTPLALSIQ